MADPLVHAKLGTTLVLMEPDALRQRDINRYMAAQRDKVLKDLGSTDPEFLYRAFYAGLKSGIVKEARVQDRPEPLTAQDINDIAPAQVHWFGNHIHSLYLEVWAIPPEAS